jgi:ABC-type multidrug transport system fused ATPase/permease subunit
VLSTALQAINSLARGRQTTAEGRERGAVASAHGAAYVDAAGGARACALLLLLFIAFYGLQLGATFWLASWSAAPASTGVAWGLGVYAVLSAASLVLLGGKSVWAVRAGVRAAAALHRGLLRTLLRLPLSFFDTTPSGRLLNRVSGDVYTLDGALPEALQGLASTALGVAASLLAAAVATPLFLLALLPLLYVYARLQRFYVATSRELQRLDSLSKSPLLSHLGETVAGLAVVRAFGRAPSATAQHAALLDANLTAYFAIISGNRWLAVRVESISAALTAAAALGAVVAAPGGGGAGAAVFPSAAGLAVSTLLGMAQSLNWLVRMRSDVESSMVAVERVQEYATLRGEGAAGGGAPPPPGWPASGALAFTGLTLAYRAGTPQVLRGVTAALPSGVRVGVVGRTGAGKSSLVAALLRTADVQGGCVMLDGVDTAGLPLPALRRAITLVPQDAALFAGTVRRNLDALGEHPDAALGAALRAVGLDARLGGAGGLNANVAEGGANFSAGERQLLAIARALLRKARVVVLDEATASVDAAGDAVVQRALREHLQGATVLTIAHRLQTVLDSDLVIVMGEGRVAEMGTPDELLEKGGLFLALVKESSEGETVSQAL